MPKILTMYHALSKPDYDQELKLRKLKILCYSKDQMDKLYPKEEYTLIGEVKKNNQKDRIARLQIADKIMPVSAPGEHSKIIFRKAGFINIGGDNYIVVLKHRLAFFIWFFGLIGGLIAAIVLLLCLLFRPKPPVINPMPSTDPHLESIPQDIGTEDDEQHEVQEQGGSVSMIYSLNAYLELSSGKVDILFQNPTKSTHDVVLELYVINDTQKTLIAQSGRIPPSTALAQLTMMEGSAVLDTGMYEGMFKVLYYNPETGERALVETEITDVKLVVR